MPVSAKISGLDAFDIVGTEMWSEAEDAIEQQLMEMSTFLINISPVDTGAYIQSHSIKANTRSSGRGKTSNRKPRNQAPGPHMDLAYSQLMEDIEKIDIRDLEFIHVSNGAPHAQDVEYGEHWNRDGYYVYAKLRKIYG